MCILYLHNNSDIFANELFIADEYTEPIFSGASPNESPRSRINGVDPLTVIDMMQNNQLQYNFYEEQMQLQRMRSNFSDQQSKLARFALLPPRR